MNSQIRRLRGACLTDSPRSLWLHIYNYWRLFGLPGTWGTHIDVLPAWHVVPAFIQVGGSRQSYPTELTEKGAVGSAARRDQKRFCFIRKVRILSSLLRLIKSTPRLREVLILTEKMYSFDSVPLPFYNLVCYFGFKSFNVWQQLK